MFSQKIIFNFFLLIFSTQEFLILFLNRDSNEKHVECLSWSHRQTELFLAEQAIFLEFDENSALPPLELHRILNRIIMINPDYSESVSLIL